MAAVIFIAAFAAIATLSSAFPVGPRSNFECPADWASRPSNAYPDINDNHAYFVCDSQGSERLKCIPGTVFNTEMQKCISKTAFFFEDRKISRISLVSPFDNSNVLPIGEPSIMTDNLKSMLTDQLNHMEKVASRISYALSMPTLVSLISSVSKYQNKNLV